MNKAITLNHLRSILSDKLPDLYATEDIPNFDDKPNMVKFRVPGIDWIYEAVEYRPDNDIIFGMVYGFESELGYTWLGEFEDANVTHVLLME